eukprot:124359_1
MSHNDLATQASTLGDRSHQKRELAAISVEMTVRQIMNSDIATSGHHGLSSMSSALNQNRSAAEIIYRRTDQIQKVINFLMTNYIDSEQANYRKGGLLGLAGVIMALTTKRNQLTYEGITFLNQVIPIIQKCLEDKDASVRYYANETLYNVIKVARYHIIQFFDLIFNQIQISCDDEDEFVRESNKSVNRLLQDVVCNYDHFQIKAFINVLQQLIRSKSPRVRVLALDWIIALDAEPDIYFLVYLHHFLNPLFALIIDHRFYHHMHHRKLKHRKLPKETQLTQQIMADFLQEISEYLQRDPQDIHPLEKFDINHIVVNLVEIVMSDNDQLQDLLCHDMHRDKDGKKKKKTTKLRMNVAIASYPHPKTTLPTTTQGKNNGESESKAGEDSGSDLEIDQILEYQKQHQKAPDGSSGAEPIFTARYSVGSVSDPQTTAPNTQKTVALRWLDTFICLGGERLKELYGSILSAVLFAMNDIGIQSTASLLNEHLMSLVIDGGDEEPMEQKIEEEPENDDDEGGSLVNDILNELVSENGVNSIANCNKYDSFDIKSVMNILIDALQQNEECAIQSRIASLKWISQLLLDGLPLVHIPHDKLLSVCFQRLCDKDRDNDNTVTHMTLEVLALLSKHPKLFEQILTNLLRLFYSKPAVLQSKGKLIITKLCQLLDCTKIYSVLANLILKHQFTNSKKKEGFVGNMVRLMNLILLTTKELYPLRHIIKKCHDNPQSKNIFLILYKTWCCSAVSLLSLCLLAQRYDLGLMLCDQFKKDIALHKSVQFLLEIDQFIHLLESPIFLHLRLQLLCYDGEEEDNKKRWKKNKENNAKERPRWSDLFQIVNTLLTLLPNSDGFHQFRVRIQMISLYKRLFGKLANKSNDPHLLNDKMINDAMYYERDHLKLIIKETQHIQAVDPKIDIQFSDKQKLFQQYLDTHTRMQIPM